MKNLTTCILALIFITFLGCRKDLEISNNSLDFSISQDSIFVSNVYSSTKSAVYSITLKNNSDNDILIPAINLKQNPSQVVLNIYGQSGQSFNDVPLLKNDSIRILFQLIANEEQNSQYYEDEIIFSDAKNLKKGVTVLGFIERSKIYYTNSDLKFINNEAILDSNKTHIFYKNLDIPKNSILRIQEGAQLRFFNKSSVNLNEGSTLSAEGTPENLIIFKGFRNEPRYDSLPGQWKGIISNNGEINLNGTVIQGANSAINARKSKININKSHILISSNYGINAIASSVNLSNSVLFNAGETLLNLKEPLTSNITHSTLANPWISNIVGISGRNIPFELRDYNDAPINVINSIFYGRYPNGVIIPEGKFSNLKFDTNLIKNENTEVLNLNLEVFSNTITDDPIFESELFSAPDLRLKQGSPGSNAGKFLKAYKTDILNEVRNNPPNIGAYK